MTVFSSEDSIDEFEEVILADDSSDEDNINDDDTDDRGDSDDGAEEQSKNNKVTANSLPEMVCKNEGSEAESQINSVARRAHTHPHLFYKTFAPKEQNGQLSFRNAGIKQALNSLILYASCRTLVIKEVWCVRRVLVLSALGGTSRLSQYR